MARIVDWATAGVNPEKVNVNGGAIALGHPLGATGARIVTSLLHEMRRQDEELGIATFVSEGDKVWGSC